MKSFKIPKKNRQYNGKEDRQKDKYSPTNTTQRFHILSENRYVYHVLTFWFSKTKTEFEIYLL